MFSPEGESRASIIITVIINNKFHPSIPRFLRPPDLLRWWMWLKLGNQLLRMGWKRRAWPARRTPPGYLWTSMSAPCRLPSSGEFFLISSFWNLNFLVFLLEEREFSTQKICHFRSGSLCGPYESIPQENAEEILTQLREAGRDVAERLATRNTRVCSCEELICKWHFWEFFWLWMNYAYSIFSCFSSLIDWLLCCFFVRLTVLSVDWLID